MSVRLEESTEIHRPADEVFAYISNVDNFPTWAGPVVEVRRTSSGPLVAGQTFTLVQKFLGRRFETPCEVTEVEPSRRFAFRSTGGPFPLSFTYTCEPSAAGTRFTEVGEGEPGSFFKLVGPLFEKAASRQFRNDAETLKELLEAAA